MPPNTPYNLVDRDGNSFTVVGDQAYAQARLNGARPQTDEENIDAAVVAAEKARYAGTRSAVRGVFEAGARAATLGLSDVLIGGLGDKYDREDLSGRRAAHPTLNTAVEIGTGVGLGVGALGKGVVGTITRGTPTGQLSAFAGRIAGTGTGRLAATVPRAVGGAAFEGYVQTFGSNLAGVARGDYKADAESLVIDPIKGAGGAVAFAGVFAGGAGLISKARKKIRASDLFDATPEAVDKATREAEQAVQGGLDAADAAQEAALAELARRRVKFADLDAELRRGLDAKKAEQQAVAGLDAAPVGAWDGADTVRHIDNPAAINAAADRAAATEARAARVRTKRPGAVPEAVDAAGDATVKTEMNAIDSLDPFAPTAGTPPASPLPLGRRDGGFVFDPGDAVPAAAPKPPSAAPEPSPNQAIIDEMHAAGVTPETLHVPDPVTKVTPFYKALRSLDPKAAELVAALEEVAPVTQAVRSRWQVYGRHIKGDPGRRSGPPLRLSLDELVNDTPGRWKQAFKDSNDRERVEILRALGPEKGRQLLYTLTDAERAQVFKSLGAQRAALTEGLAQIKYNKFQQNEGAFGGAWEAGPNPQPTFAEQVKQVAASVDPSARRGQFKVFLSDIRKNPAFAKLTDEEWAAKLFEARRSGDLTLGRIDMAGDDLARVEASAIRAKGADAAEVQHYVEVPPTFAERVSGGVPVADDVVQATERWAKPDWLDDALSLSVPVPAARKPMYDAADEAAKMAADIEVSAARRAVREEMKADAPAAIAPERTAKGSGPAAQAPEQVFDDPYASRADLDDWSPIEADNIVSAGEGAEQIAALERGIKNLDDALGELSPPQARVLAQQTRDALADQERRAMKAATHAIEADAVPAQVADQEALAGGWPGASPRRAPNRPFVAPPSPVLAERLRAQGWDVMSPINVPPPAALVEPPLYKSVDEYEAAMLANYGPRTGLPKVGLPRNPERRQAFLADYAARHGIAPTPARADVALAATMPGTAAAKRSDTLTGGLRAGDATLPGMAGDVPGAPPSMPPSRSWSADDPFAPGAPAGSVRDPRDPFAPTYKSGQRPGYANELQDAATLASRAPRPTPTPATGKGATVKEGGLWSTLADAGAVLEAVQAVGVATPLDPDKIPLVGPVLGAYLKFRALGMAGRKLGFRVPWTRNTATAARGQKVRARMYGVVDKILGAGEKGLRAGAVVAASQSWRLKDVLERSLPPEAKERGVRKKLKDEAALVMEHARVWRERAYNPEAVRAAVVKRLTVDLDGDGTPDPPDPDLVEEVVAVEQRKAEYLAKHAPVEPPPNLLYRSRWEPAPAERVRYARRLRAVADPATVYEDILAGTLTTEAVDAFKTVYPDLFAKAQARLLERAAAGPVNLPPAQVAQISTLFGVAMRPTLEGDTMQRIQEAGAPELAAAQGQPPPQAMTPPAGGAPNLAPMTQPNVYRMPGQ